MNNRSPALLLSIALGGCFLLLVCAAALGLGGYLLFTQGNQLFSGSALALNRIAYLDNDLNLNVIDPRSGQKTPLTHDADGGTTRGYAFPTWSPDDRRIAFVEVNYANGQATDGLLESIASGGGSPVTLFKSDENLPFYLYWSPDSRYLGFLRSKSATALSLAVVSGAVENSPQELESGSPLYWAWSPDSRNLFLHVGGTRQDSAQARLAVRAVAAKNAAQPLASLPGTFQAPQWSPDGQHLLFSQEDAAQKDTLALADAHGENVKTLLNYDGRIAFAWSPAGDRIAYLVTGRDLQLPNFGDVYVMDTQGKNSTDVSNEHTLAFFWSPNGKRLAYLTVNLGSNNSSYRFIGPALQGSTTVQLEWKVRDFDTNTAQTIATFNPTDNFISLLPYFDQYALSITFWSPDSQSLVYANGEAGSSGSLWIADASGKSQPRRIGEGLIGFWSWR